MPQYTQAGRPLAVASPLGTDALLLEVVSGDEALSTLFQFELDLLAEPGTDVPFEKVLGQGMSVSVRMPDDSRRLIAGIVNRFSQGAEVRSRDGDHTFIRYRATLVPRFWLLTRRVQSRIFQQKTVPEILKIVLGDLPQKLQLLGTYEPRDYCVQYRETDFAFASRLMEEEGIYYYFTHGEDGDTLVLSDHTQGHAAVSPADIIYETVEGGNRPEERIFAWEKTQEVRSGRVMLWDHCFELPHENLEAVAKIQPTVSAGGVTHDLTAGGADGLEVYEFPGRYAQRFDGVTPGGRERPDDLDKIYADNARTTKLRMEQVAARSLAIAGESNCPQLTAGHWFNLKRHFNADGKYVLTKVKHRSSMGSTYTTRQEQYEVYENRFECIPADLPFRPEPITERPVIHGTQTAVVVGDKPDEEIFTDQYGRVKVQFHWDRQGKHDAESSCWIRVSQVHAGKKWGGIDIPRVGEEVIVAFEDGDPDRPIVIGRVYNAREMPPFELPKKKMVSGLKSNTYKGGGSNEISMNDTAGGQQMYVHAEKDQDEVVKNNQTSKVGNNRTKTIGGNETSSVGANRTEDVTGNHDETIGGDMVLTVKGSEAVNVGVNQITDVGQSIVIQAGVSITLKCGASMIHMNQAGVIAISGSILNITGTMMANLMAPLTTVDGIATFTTGALVVSAALATNKVMAGVTTTVDGGTVKINC